MTPEEFHYWNEQFGNHDEVEDPPVDNVVGRVREYTAEAFNPEFTDADIGWLQDLGISLD